MPRCIRLWLVRLLAGREGHAPAILYQLMRWQKRARLGVAVFGIACAIVVYAAIGERATGTPPARRRASIRRPIIESEGAQVQQERGVRARLRHQVRAPAHLRGRLHQAHRRRDQRPRPRAGVTSSLTGREAQAGENQQDLQIDRRRQAGGQRRLRAHGRERASFSRGDGIVRAPGPIAFRKGRMTGSGVGMTYDQKNDVLSLARAGARDDDRRRRRHADGVHRRLRDAGPPRRTSSTLDGNVHALRGEQVFEADRGTARLTDDEDVITFIELRGNARVAGGERRSTR